MLKKRWMTATAVLIGITALIAWYAVKARSVIDDFVETDDGEQVLALALSGDTSWKRP